MTEPVRNDATTTNSTNFAEGVGVVGDGTGAGSTSDQDPGDLDDSGRSYGQDEVDKIVQRRLKRQENKLRQELQDQAAEEARRQRMDETERLRTEKQEAIQAAKNRESVANQRIMLAEAKATAAGMGVPQESLKYISRLVDLADIDIDVDGTPDEDAIKGAVQQVLNDVPALVKKAEETPQEGSTPPLTNPMGRDRTPAVSSGNGGGSGPSAKDLFNQRLRNRTR